MEEKFNQQKYINEYKKNNYKRIMIELPKADAEIFEKKLEEINMKKSTFLKNCIYDFIKQNSDN